MSRLGPSLQQIAPCGAPLSMRFAGRDLFQSMLLRQGEPEEGGSARIESAYLEKYATDDPRYGVMAAFWNEEPIGVSSFAVIDNPNRALQTGDAQRRWYGRIDVMVVPPEYRGLGLARWLMTANLRYMLEAWPGAIYSLSTMAAHPATSRILYSYGFETEQRAGFSEPHAALEVSGESEAPLLATLRKWMVAQGQRAFFKARQSGVFAA